MNERLPNRRGDQEKRVCKQYGICPHFTEKWEDENGAQLHCPICNVAQYVDYGEEL